MMILITGGAGYVGSHFLRYFLAQEGENSALVVDDLSRGHRSSLPGDKRVVFEECAIGDAGAIDRILARYPIEAVVHFAANAYVGESQIEPFRYFRNNVMQSLAFFESLEKRNIRRLVFSSSCATYGNPLYLPLDEEHPQKPTNVYGATKLMIEEALQALVNSLGWSATCLRYFNAAGASADASIGESHNPETHLIANVLRVAAGHEASVLVNGNDYETRDGTCIRDYVHVDDLARAHWQALHYMVKQKQPGFLALNLGTASGATILDVIDLCEQITASRVAKRFGPRRSGDPPALVANSAKARALLDWQPSFGLKETIETAWQWEKNRRF